MFHAHLTISNNIHFKGWKQTQIELIGNQNHTDFMLTKYFNKNCSLNDVKQQIFNDVEILKKETNVLRVKIEQENVFETISNENYFECHVLTTEVLSPDWKRSRNPKHDNIFWWTKRFYTGNINEIVNSIKQSLNNIVYKEIKFEQAMFDSNVNLDFGWLSN